MKVIIFALLALVTSLCVTSAVAGGDDVTRNVSMTMQFVVSIKATWEDCQATVSTPFLHSDRDYNDSAVITVGHCDQAPLTFYVTSGSQDGFSKMDVTVTFYTHQISAMPPQCVIPWNGTYLSPTTLDPSQSPLPGCWTSDSQEGWHPMEFWFWILDWNFL
ncbi:uncharacterized protein [Littorina saxatilis]|uniref:Uncharacterized protein n=1 Tax=Littorina saxatilis TaxID=31220 RepID=A0AAN9B2W6_9CAEN